MTPTLPSVAHEHHERLVHHVDRMPEMGDLLLSGTADAIARGLVETNAFLSGTLVPHMEAAERTLYPELERMMQNMHSMSPMRREHAEVRRLVEQFGSLTHSVQEGHVTLGKALALRRVIFQLYALMKVHLAEEEAYLRIVNHGVSAEVADVLAAAMAHPVAGEPA